MNNVLLINPWYLGWVVARSFDPRYGEMHVMYTSDRSEVYNYMDLKLACGRSTAKFCLLLTSKVQVGLRMCVNFYVPWNPRGKICHQQSELLSTSGVYEKAAQTEPNLRYWGIRPKSDMSNVRANEFWLYIAFNIVFIISVLPSSSSYIVILHINKQNKYMEEIILFKNNVTSTPSPIHWTCGSMRFKPLNCIFLPSWWLLFASGRIL